MIDPSTDKNYFRELAHSKLALVFGNEKAERLVREIAADGGLAEISSAQDLLVFSAVLKRRGGFESTVGAMLGLQAVLRGAAAI
jgi:hypothetical protein